MLSLSKIVVIDNGCRMTHEMLSSTWMNIGTDDKEVNLLLRFQGILINLYSKPTANNLSNKKIELVQKLADLEKKNRGIINKLEEDKITQT